MNERTINSHTRKIRQKLSKADIDCLLVTKTANVSYVTGFLGEDSWAAVTKNNVYLLTDSRYTEQAGKKCPVCKVIERKGVMTKAVGELIKKLKAVNTVAVENSISLADFRALKKDVAGRVKTSAGIVESVRIIKEADEIAAISEAGRIAGKAFKKCVLNVKTGITENELAGVLDFEIRKLGAQNSFESIVAFGANASRPHHKPTQKRLKKNDSVLIDWGVKYKGYCCDMTRSFAVGKVSSLYKKVYEVVRQGKMAAIKMVKAGVEKAVVDAAAREVIEESGLEVYGHGTGHGLGLEVHEGPIVAAKSKGNLLAGMVLTIEPGIYIPGKLGVRIEDDILVTETGCKVLTSKIPQK